MKKIIAFFLSLLIVISIIPMTKTTASAATYSGKCGDNLTWTFDDTSGTLTISGTGAMYDFDFFDRPWENYKDNIKKVVINNGVTTIGEYAFYDCKILTNIIIPNSVTTIGSYVCGRCFNLGRVTIPDSVISIGDFAFNNDINVDKNNQYYSTDEYGVLFNKDKTELISFPGNVTNYTIPLGVVTIGYSAFQGGDIISVTIPDSVTMIDAYAFNECYNLTSVTIGNGVTTIGEFAFAECDLLANITIPKSVTIIGEGAFCSCKLLTSITIPKSVTIIGEEAFSGCSSLADVYYEGTEEQWSQIEIDEYNEQLSNANTHFNSIPNSNSDTDTSWTFDEETGTLEILEDIKENDYDKDNRPWKKHIKEIKIVIIHVDVTVIPDGAFKDCTELKEVTIPKTVKKIGKRTFENCSALKKIYYEGTKNDWGKIEVGDSNSILEDVNIKYNSKDKDTSSTITILIIVSVVAVVIAIACIICLIVVNKKKKKSNQ